jgi:hypothetical protein
MSLGNRALKIAENPLGVVSLDPEAKVIEPQMLPRFIGGVQTKKPVLELQFTEIFPLIVNRKSRELLIKGFGSLDIGGSYRYVIQRACTNQWLLSGAGTSLTREPRAENKSGKSLHQCAAADASPLIQT